MQTIKSFFLLFVLTSAASAASGPPFSTNINPALTYYLAFQVAPDFSATDQDFLSANQWAGQKLPGHFGQLVAQYDTEFRFLRQAAHSTAPCDWGIDWNAGPEALLPHLARIKKAANAARLRAMWDLQHGLQSDAREDLLAALALARNGAVDGCLIAALVQIAAEKVIYSTVAENYSQFAPETLQQLADGLNAPPRGTIADCIPMEKFAFDDWMVNRVRQSQASHPGNDPQVMEDIHHLVDFVLAGGEVPKETNSAWQKITEASGGTSDGVIKLLREMDPVYARLGEIEALPPAQYAEQMPPFGAEIKRSTNPFIRAFSPALEKCRPKEFGALAELAMVQAAVQYKLHGAAGLQSVSNPLGQGPFALQRFVFDGVDRGFELDAAYTGQGSPEVLIFVETGGPPFQVSGKNAGLAPSP